MPTRKTKTKCPYCQKKYKEKEKQQVSRFNHKAKEDTDRKFTIKRDKKGNVKDFDFDVSFDHSQSMSFSFD